ncbi:hypothetical protein ACFQ1M_01645 [Sungkyunkwania multivorans]|uniref:Uncharacterized protein n=1 Tax=Sungkyunkwania multivorans TaxID=1173618 RepID=A0ABW3CVN8_9FLAO
MNKTAGIILLIIGLALAGYGIYQMVTPDAQAEVLGVELSASDNKVSTQSIVMVVLGAIAIIGGAMISKRK